MQPWQQGCCAIAGQLLFLPNQTRARPPHPLYRRSLCESFKDSAGRNMTTCDWTKLKQLARPGTYCLGTRCQGSIMLNPAQREQQLLFAYPKCESRGGCVLEEWSGVAREGPIGQ